MKKRNQLKNIKTPIDHVWQVELTRENWQRIIKETEKRKTTFSWVVRHCVFSLINQLAEIPLEKIDIALDECKTTLQEREHPLHRLQLCLYGDDTLLLQTAAIQCGLSVSMLIRIALLFNLPQLEKNYVNRASFYWHGIKFIAKAVASIGNIRVRPYSWLWTWQNFSVENYYGMPRPYLGCIYRAST